MSEPVAKTLVACQYVTMDRNNRYSLIDVFDRIRPVTLPYLHGFYVYGMIANPSLKGSTVVQVVDQGGMVVWTSGKVPFALTDPTDPSMALCQQIGPILFTEYGRYRIAVFVGSDLAGDLELKVISPHADVKEPVDP